MAITPFSLLSRLVHVGGDPRWSKPLKRGQIKECNVGKGGYIWTVSAARLRWTRENVLDYRGRREEGEFWMDFAIYPKTLAKFMNGCWRGRGRYLTLQLKLPWELKVRQISTRIVIYASPTESGESAVNEDWITMLPLVLELNLHIILL